MKNKIRHLQWNWIIKHYIKSRVIFLLLLFVQILLVSPFAIALLGISLKFDPIISFQISCAILQINFTLFVGLMAVYLIFIQQEAIKSIGGSFIEELFFKLFDIESLLIVSMLFSTIGILLKGQTFYFAFQANVVSIVSLTVVYSFMCTLAAVVLTFQFSTIILKHVVDNILRMTN